MATHPYETAHLPTGVMAILRAVLLRPGVDVRTSHRGHLFLSRPRHPEDPGGGRPIKGLASPSVLT
jgi:hypothetical protein